MLLCVQCSVHFCWELVWPEFFSCLLNAMCIYYVFCFKFLSQAKLITVFIARSISSSQCIPLYHGFIGAVFPFSLFLIPLMIPIPPTWPSNSNSAFPKAIPLHHYLPRHLSRFGCSNIKLGRTKRAIIRFLVKSKVFRNENPARLLLI